MKLEEDSKRNYMRQMKERQEIVVHTTDIESSIGEKDQMNAVEYTKSSNFQRTPNSRTRIEGPFISKVTMSVIKTE